MLDAQRRAEDTDLTPDARARALEQVRLWVPAVSAVDDMLALNNLKAHKSCRKRVEDNLKVAVQSKEDLPEPVGPWSWLRYEETEGLALERITKATLEHRSQRPRNPLGRFKRDSANDDEDEA